MPQAYLFSEEGRAGRGPKIVLLLFAALWLAVSCVFGYAVFIYHTKANLTPLQRIYLPQYRRGAWRSLLTPFSPKSRYLLLVRTGTNQQTKKVGLFLCRDHEITAVYDDAGLIRFDKDNRPDLRFKLPYPEGTKQIGWSSDVRSDSEMYDIFRQDIYKGKGFIELLYPSALGAVMLFFPGLVGAGLFERRRTKRHLKGTPLRGTRELTPKQYAREMRRKATGVGIEVYTQEGR